MISMCVWVLASCVTCRNYHKLSTHSLLILLPIHSHHHSPCSHHSGTSPPGVWPLEDDQHQLPASVGYDHPEDWVGHSQYRTQQTTCINELNSKSFETKPRIWHMEFVNSLDVSTQTRVIISNEKLQKLAHLNTLGLVGKMTACERW